MTEHDRKGEAGESQETLARRTVSHDMEPASDSTPLIRDWLRAELRSDMRVLDLSPASSTPAPTLVAKGEVRELVGGVTDRAVLRSPAFDHAVRIEDDWLPLAERSFDLVWSDGGLEQWERPAAMLAEIHRLLKPGGQFFFRTVNLRHYRTFGQWILSDGLWSRVDRALGGTGSSQPNRAQHFMRANTRARLTRLASAAGFTDIEFRMVEPASDAATAEAWTHRLSARYQRLVNRSDGLAGLRGTILGRFRR